MKILIDGDACPVINIVKEIAQEKRIALIIFCDTSHIINTNYGDVVVVDKGADAVDFALINQAEKGDIIVTQDYGVAALALGKGAFSIHQSGKWYNNENIDQMLMDRHIAKEIRRGNKKSHLKGPKKRTDEVDRNFKSSFYKIVEYASGIK